MSSTLGLLREQFPGRVLVGLPEVAQVLRGHDSHAAREAVRAGIDAGDILPGLRKTRGRWLVPLSALADWIDGRVQAPEQPQEPRRVVRHSVAPPTEPPPRRRGRLPDSVRLPRRAARLAAQRQRAGQFFQQVRAMLARDDFVDRTEADRPRG